MAIQGYGGVSYMDVGHPPCRLHVVHIYRTSQTRSVCRPLPDYTLYTHAVPHTERNVNIYHKCASEFRTEECQFRTEKRQFRPEKCQFRTEKCQFRPERCQFRPEKCQFLHTCVNGVGCELTRGSLEPICTWFPHRRC